MILPITALRLAVAAAVENVTTPLPGDFPDGDVIIWRRSDEGSDNSTWLPPPLPSSFIPDKPDPGLTPDYNTRIRLPQNSTDVLTVADIAEIESMLVRLNETTNDTSSFESETPTERVRRSVGDEDEQDDDDDDNNVSPSKSDANSGLTAEGESVPGYSEDAQMRPAPKMDDQTSEFFSKFLGLKSDDHVEKTHEDLVEPSSLLQKDEDFNEQVRDRRQATATSSITSASNDVVSTTARSQKPTTVAPSEQQTPVVAEATTVVPPEETTLVVTQPTTIAASEPTTLKISQTSSEIFSPSPLPTENIQEKREEKTPGLPTTQPEVSTEQPVPEILSFPIQPSDFFSQGFHPPGFFPQGLFPQYPQSGYPQYPQNANPQYQQGGYPQYNQNANPQYQQGGYPQYSQSAYPQYPPGTYPQYPQGAYPQYPQYPQNQRGFYPNPSGIIDPGFAPDPNRQLLQRAREEQRQKGLRQPESHVPNSHWQGYPGGSGIIDPGFAPRPIDPLLQRDLDLQRENSGRQVLGGQQENKMTPELNIVHADGSTQGYPPNAPFRDQGAEAPRMDDTLIQQTQGQARQDQEQLRPPASQAETGNSAETLTPSDSAVPESNRE